MIELIRNIREGNNMMSADAHVCNTSVDSNAVCGIVKIHRDSRSVFSKVILAAVDPKEIIPDKVTNTVRNMICEKCWEDACGQWDRYLELLEERKDNPCSDLEQEFGNYDPDELTEPKTDHNG